MERIPEYTNDTNPVLGMDYDYYQVSKDSSDLFGPDPHAIDINTVPQSKHRVQDSHLPYPNQGR